MKRPRRAERSASNLRRRSWSVMGVAEVSPSSTPRQPNGDRSVPPHIRPSTAVPAHTPSGGYGVRSVLSNVGSFSLIVGVVLLVLTAGIVWADIAMTRMTRNEARHDAEEARLLMHGRLDLKLEWLGVLRTLFLDGVAVRPHVATLLATNTESDVEAARGVERVWVLDSAGAVVHDTTLVAERILTEEARALAVARQALDSGKAQVGVVGNALETRRIVVATPLLLGGRRVGAGVALVRPSPLVRNDAQTHARDRLGLVLLQGPDTLAVIGDPAREADAVRGVDTFPVYGGARWVIEARHTSLGLVDRGTMLALALLTLTFLAIVLLRERRQALRVAERSAELERLSSELLRANRMKSEFLANVSHELRTPLNAIVGFVELLRDGVYGELTPRQAQPVERIAASATHLRGLVDQVLDIAKMAAGRLEVHPETIVLRPFVLNVMSELESLIAEKGLTLSISVGASLPRVRTDPAHLRSILVNLIGNAIKYTEQGGIVVRARLVGAPRAAMATPVGERTLMEEATLAAAAPSRDHPWIALQVIDTGIGVAPEDRERIFDEFEQVNAGPRGESMSRGTGLGLAITRRLARLLGGDVRVESEVGRGSTFTLWMPVSASEMGARAGK